MRRAVLVLCLTAISVKAFAGTCADVSRASQRVADVRDAGVEMRVFLGMPEASANNKQAVLLRELANIAYRYPLADGQKLVAMYRPKCARPELAPWEPH